MEPSLQRVEKDHFSKELQSLAKAVESLLRAARETAHVDIVTLGNRNWFDKSAQYLPGLEIKELFKELDITVYFAEVSLSCTEADRCVAAKRVVMGECLMKRFGAGKRWHAISIGDKDTERDALKACCHEYRRRLKRQPLCKTVMLPEEPMLDVLVSNLEHLRQQCGRMVALGQDFDWTVSDIVPAQPTTLRR